MSIQMVGIDYNTASIEEREIFSYTNKQTDEYLAYMKNIEGILGCIILSTCNRMEVWVSYNEKLKDNLLELICDNKQISKEQVHHKFVERKEYDAVRHLFYLTSGMKSQIIGEDQILAQVKKALEHSRNNQCTDNVLEVLFRMAITSAKEIKTKVHLSRANSSIVDQAIFYLQSMNYDIREKQCLVIGNGEIGKLAATRLLEEGAKVTMTLRQYKSGVIEIPIGCQTINYSDRLDHITNYDMIISATASPKTTLSYDQLSGVEFLNPMVLIDLAVPRDIDPKLGTLNQVTLYDVDFFHVDTQSDKMKQQLEQIDIMLKEQLEEFISWYTLKDSIPLMQNVSSQAAVDIQLRIQKTVKKLPINPDEKVLLEESIHLATNKVISKLIFGMRDTVSLSAFQECMDAIQKIY